MEGEEGRKKEKGAGEGEARETELKGIGEERDRRGRDGGREGGVVWRGSDDVINYNGEAVRSGPILAALFL